MKNKKSGVFLLSATVVLAALVMPLLGYEYSDGLRMFTSIGAITYSKYSLGMWYAQSGALIPPNATWVITGSPDYGNVNLLENPSFERNTVGWKVFTPTSMTSLGINVFDGWIGKSVAMVGDQVGYEGGLFQTLEHIPPSTTFHFKAMMKTLDVAALEVHALYCEAFDEQGNWYGSQFKTIKGSSDWTAYEFYYTTPNKTTIVNFFPALVYNKGQVLLDETYVDTTNPVMYPRTGVSLILNWINLAWSTNFKNDSEIKEVEEEFKRISPERFWGIIFFAEETYKIDLDFDGNVNTTWFGERVLGYTLYASENPNATRDEWQEEMYFRLIRGFYSYFHGKTKVGITCGVYGVDYYFGQLAVSYIRQYYDFVILYKYTTNLDDFKSNISGYLSLMDDLFSQQKKFWILTRIWDHNEDAWKPEAIALEMKNCLDRNMTITTYYDNNPPLEETWPLVEKAVQLYENKTTYYEDYVYGENLLTGYIGNTYGWVHI